jgi:hypothetical protein
VGVNEKNLGNNVEGKKNEREKYKFSLQDLKIITQLTYAPNLRKPKHLLMQQQPTVLTKTISQG